ncbi:hypothetical protein GTQ34_16180 [Muricauda sp. JGD-17]|uniref:Tissue inhibitor of metalloproteinase n=1 Tax=Flagellimonas ochracea TaxID=2696472 RepID=A0A964TEG3_9FLAO|nr:hypothetical protein [Allomuricauda ochracea]NAY93450.1 hypothetical protein [Allomuricauda ochracea]
MRKILFLLLVLSASKSFACTCRGYDLERELRFTTAILHARVLKIDFVSKGEIFTEQELQYLENKFESQPKMLNVFQRKSVTKVEIEIIDSYKGDMDRTRLTIYTSMHGPSCGYFGFEVGKEFIVFLHPERLSKRFFGDYNNGINRNRLWTNRCTRTMIFDKTKAGEIIEGLKSLE